MYVKLFIIFYFCFRSFYVAALQIYFWIIAVYLLKIQTPDELLVLQSVRRLDFVAMSIRFLVVFFLMSQF